MKVKQVHRKVNRWKLSRAKLPFVITISVTLCSCYINLVFSKPIKNKASQNNFYFCSILSPNHVQMSAISFVVQGKKMHPTPGLDTELFMSQT